MAELRTPHGSALVQPGGTGDDAWLVPMRREMRCLEDKISRQLLRFQDKLDQSQRLVDMMLEPLDAKVAVLEGKFKGNDGQMAELAGGVRGLQELVQVQVQRADAAEARFQRWRKSLESDLLSRFANLEKGPVVKTQEVVTHNDLADVAGLMKTELQKIMHESIAKRSGNTATRDEVEEIALEVRELHHEISVMRTANGREDLNAAAESLRAELRRLTESSLGGKQFDLERQELEVLTERATQSKAAMEEVSSDIRHLRDELRSRGLLGGTGPWAQPPLSREEVQLIAEQACGQARSLGVEEIGFVVRELEERITETGKSIEGLVGETSQCRSMADTLAVVQDTINMRLEAMEVRQRSLRDEVRGCSPGMEPWPSPSPWHTDERDLRKDMQHAVDVPSSKISQRLGDLERAGYGNQLEGLTRRMQALEMQPKIVEEHLHEHLQRIEGLEHHALEENAKDGVTELSAQVSSLWTALAEVADLANANCRAMAKPEVTSEVPDSVAESPEQPVERSEAEQRSHEVTASAAEAMVGAVRDAVAAVAECRKDADGCQRQLGTLAAEFLDLRGDWATLRTRTAACEKCIRELQKAGAAVEKEQSDDAEGDEQRQSSSPSLGQQGAPETLHPKRKGSRRPGETEEVA